jgi:hypothetical protein
MSRSIAIVCVLAFGTAAGALADDGERGPGNERGGTAKKDANECVSVTHEARYRNYGYDHIVHLANTCGAGVTCKVSTDVNPEPTTVSLKKGDKQSVVTFTGSPAREFKPQTECKLE